MDNIFELTTRPDPSIFYSNNDNTDPRMGDIVRREPHHYASSDVVILGCPQDEGIRRGGGCEGAAKAPSAIRDQFYRLTTFNMRKRVFDLGDTMIGDSLEKTHETHAAIVQQVLRDGKRIIVLGGGGDISYPDGISMAEVFGAECWIAVNVDSQMDVRAADQRTNLTQFRDLLEGKFLLPTYLYQVGFQTHFCSPVRHEYARVLNVHRISLELMRSRAEADVELKDLIRDNFIGHSTSLNTFFSFDMSAVRAADAPGTSETPPLGLRAGEFITLVKYAASLANTKIVEFTEVHPQKDVDDRTAKLVAIGMHRFCTGVA
jgi:formiminoglutamase